MQISYKSFAEHLHLNVITINNGSKRLMETKGQRLKLKTNVRNVSGKMSKYTSNSSDSSLFTRHFSLLSRSPVKLMKKEMMKTAGVARTRRTRTHSSTWMSLCFRRAPATCYRPCASWLYSTPSSLLFVCSGTTV